MGRYGVSVQGKALDSQRHVQVNDGPLFACVVTGSGNTVAATDNRLFAARPLHTGLKLQGIGLTLSLWTRRPTCGCIGLANWER